MGLDNRNIFFIIFLIVTVLFSWLAYQPDEVIIGGPFFPEMDYFQEELDEISRYNDLLEVLDKYFSNDAKNIKKKQILNG